MTAQDIATLKGYFNTGDTPTEAQFTDLVDSTYNRDYHIRDYGWTDGMADAGTAIQAAIDATPNRVQNGDRPARSHIVWIPQDSSGETDITTKVTIGAFKSVELRGEGSHSSVLIRWGGVGDYWLRIAAGQRVAAVRNLNMNDGGIEIEGNTRKHWGMFDCTFKDAPDYAIKTLGSSVIDGMIDNCLFAECANGVFFAYDQTDINVIRNCAFLVTTGTAIHLRTSGVHVIDCDFERNGLNIHLDKHADGTATGDLRFTNCRFGNEGTAPVYEILVGQDTSTTGSAIIGYVTFIGCYFRGLYAADPLESQAILKLMNPVRDFTFIGCNFWDYLNFAEEDYFVDHGAKNVQNNTIIGPQPKAGLGFTKGGVGWELTPAPRQLSADSDVSSDTGEDVVNIAIWTTDDVTVAKDATDPTGAANNAYTITRTGSGNAGISEAVGNLDTDYEHYVFSVWARAVDEYKMRLAYISAGNWIYLNVLIQLSDQWRKYWITFPSAAAGTSGNVHTLIGQETDGKSTGEIEVWNPKLAYGTQPE
jgi:hypothetical protein